VVFQGERVLVDATFWEESRRRTFLEAAKRWGVPGFLFLCHAEPDIVQRRLAARVHDVSDADWAVYSSMLERWQQPGASTRSVLRDIPTGGEPAEALLHALEALKDLQL
jgi:predicted kinase